MLDLILKGIAFFLIVVIMIHLHPERRIKTAKRKIVNCRTNGINAERLKNRSSIYIKS